MSAEPNTVIVEVAEVNELVIENLAQIVEVETPTEITVVTVDVTGPQGPPGPAGDVSDFEQTFSEALSWTVNHNLGRFPIPTVYSPGGAIMEAEIVNVTVNQLVVYFVAPTAGKIRCV